MSQNNTSFIPFGLDVAKDSLALDFQGHIHSLSNNATGHAWLLQKLGKVKNPHVIIEATGGYEQPVVRSLHAAGIALSVVQPSRVRSYAKAKGQLAKTDPIDAALLTEFGASIHPSPTLPPSAEQLRLQELVGRRRQLIETTTAESNRSAHYIDPLVRRQARRFMEFLGNQIKQCEKAIAALIAKQDEMASRSARLQQVQGVGFITAATLLAEMPELGLLTDQTAAAIAGVAPYNCDSGPCKGSRRIRGGRHHVRSSLYMATLCAVRFDPVLKAFYLNLRNRGKKPLVALTAAMRKLIILLNRLIKDPSWSLSHPS